MADCAGPSVQVGVIDGQLDGNVNGDVDVPVLTGGLNNSCKPGSCCRGGPESGFLAGKYSLEAFCELAAGSIGLGASNWTLDDGRRGPKSKRGLLVS